MCRLQVFDWGTFSGLHDIPIAERGFLFVGRSGSGKSTLLDAIAALLTPPAWVDFNAAAREAERSGRDRSLVSYLRGAWADRHDEDSGELATQYLRRGTTWSALALSFHDGGGRYVSLVRLLWITGNGVSAGDVRKHYMVVERPFDVAAELDGFDLDVRRLKKRIADAYHHEQFTAYAERFRHLLGIDNENALRLLHKTQSAKNLGDLNRFLREFMLERPPTFDAAARLVDEFAELDAAHRAVVTARQQIELLRPARDAWADLQATRRESDAERELQSGVDGFRERRLAALLEARLAAIAVEDLGLADKQRSLDDLKRRHEDTVATLTTRYQDSGGAEIERLQRASKHWAQERDDRARRRRRAQEACAALGWTLADAPERFVEQRDEARRRVEASAAARRELEAQLDEQRLQLRDAGALYVKLARELDALRRHPSNLPEPMQALRRRLCAAIGLDDGALPFVGELLQVRADAADWRGAIERVLHGFAQALLVEERHYTAVAQWVNDTHLGGKLVYYRIDRPDAVQPRRPGPESLVRKLELAQHPHRDWLQAELLRRFDYDCVDSPRRLRERERALTREGQIKHGRHRHEKDDRNAIDDRRYWMLGFDNRDKQRLFEEDLAAAARRQHQLQRRCGELEQRRDREVEGDASARELGALDWHEIDVAPALQEVDRIDALLQLTLAQSNDLAELERKIAHARQRIGKLDGQLVRLAADRLVLERDLKKRQGDLDACRQRVATSTLQPPQERGLAERLDALPALTLDNLHDHFRQIERAIGERIRTLESREGALGNDIRNSFAAFMRQWPHESGDFRAELDFAGDFFARLKRLEDDRLPEFEHRFFELLRTQSGQNLAALQTHVQQALKQIRVRMLDVNAALERVPFNRDTRLQINVEDRGLQEVALFRQQMAAVLSHRQTDDRELAERQFDALRQLVLRLASKDPDAVRWRELVLDVRLHVDFTGEELDADSGRQVEVYRSGAGKSGGQRQKLATTCLAAALRYQLGSDVDGLPRYAAVVLDEAFDKADNEFTAMAMGIFENFGFQMIVATPLKSVMTLEPFIGGACFVDIHGRHDSGVLLIEYDEANRRLRLPENAGGALADA